MTPWLGGDASPPNLFTMPCLSARLFPLHLFGAAPTSPNPTVSSLSRIPPESVAESLVGAVGEVALTIGTALRYSRAGGRVPSAEDEEFTLLPLERDTALTVLPDSQA